MNEPSTDTDFENPDNLAAELFETTEGEETKIEEVEAPEATDEPENEDEPSEKDSAEGDEQPEGEVENVYTVKVDGEEFEVTETELIKGYQTDRYNTQKAQALSEEKRTWEHERQGEVEQLRNALAYYALPSAKEPRPEDFANHPDPNAAFVQAYGEWQQLSSRQSEAAQLLEAITAEEQRRTLEREAGLLQQAIPEWADETVRQADYGKMMQAASDRYGFTQEEIAGVTDHRLLLLLRDASRFAEVNSQPVVLKRKTEIKPKLSAGAKAKTDPNNERHDKALNNLTKGTATEDDLGALFFQ